MSFLQHFQLKPRQSIAIYRHRNLETMAPKDLGKGIAPKDLGKGIGGEEKSSHNRAGLGKGGARHSQKPRPDVGLLTEAMAPHIALADFLRTSPLEAFRHSLQTDSRSSP